MKRHFLQGENQKKRPYYPFWMPWGCLGCLWRLLCGMAAIAAFVFLLLLLASIPKSCDRNTAADDPGAGGGGAGPTPPPAVLDEPPFQLNDSVPDAPVPDPKPLDKPIEPYKPKPGDLVRDPKHGELDGKHLMVIINPRNSIAPDPIEAFCRQFKELYPGGTIDLIDDKARMIVIGVPEDRREEIREALPGQIKDVAFFVDIIEIFRGGSVQVDPAVTEPETKWQYTEVLAPEGWEITTGKPEVKVAVIDTYFDLSHPEFAGLNMLTPISVVNGNTDVSPQGDPNSSGYSHGTHVLGLVAAQVNGAGTQGISPNVTVLPISVGSPTNSVDLMRAVLYALDEGAMAINISMGITIEPEEAAKIPLEEQVREWLTENKRLESAWDYVYEMLDENYCTLVWSAGNNNLFELMESKKRNPSTIKVDAVDSNLNKTGFSNFGNFDFELDGTRYEVRESVISAPGAAVVSTFPNRSYALADGTSMAAPIVTGAVALMKSLDPTLTNAEVIEILQTTAKPLPNDSIGKLLQIAPALEMVKDRMNDWKDFERDPAGKDNIWKKTSQTSYYSTTPPNEFLHYGHEYFIFNDRNSGVMEVHIVGENDVHNARFHTRWGKDECWVLLEEQLADPEGSKIVKYDYRLFKDPEGKVGIEWNNTNSTSVSGNIRRLKKDDRINDHKRAL